MKFAKKFFKQFDVEYNVVKEGKTAFTIDKESIKYSNANGKNMVIIMNKKKMSLFDHIFGPSEKSFIGNKYNIPTPRYGIPIKKNRLFRKTFIHLFFINFFFLFKSF